MAEPAIVSTSDMQHFTGHDEVEDILRGEFVPALCLRHCEPLLGGSVPTLDGEDHLARRRLENPLFQRRALAYYEHDVLTDSLQLAFDQAERNRDALGRPHIDLQWLTRMAVVPITAAVVGLDGVDTEDRITQLEDISRRLGEGARVEWSNREVAEVMAEVMEARDELVEHYYVDSLARRKAIVASWRAGDIEEDDLPIDLLTLVLKQEGDDLDEELWLREVLFFVVASANTMVASSPHVFNEIVEWLDANPGNEDVVKDIGKLRHAVEEGLRLHGPTPSLLRRAKQDCDVDGRHVAESEDIACMLGPANTDADLYGATAEDYNPHRSEQVGRLAAHGLSFGAGAHLCSGRPIAIGLPTAREGEAEIVGVLPRLMHELFARGATPDPDDPPRLRTDTKVGAYAAYSVVFTKWPS